MILREILWIVFSFLFAAVPFSLLVGFVFLRKDIRQFGDGNPGATNVYRAGGGVPLMILAVVLDVAKGAFPVGMATFVFRFEGIALLLAAIAPLLGHGYSPFLGFKGGKMMATTLGIWIGLTLYFVPAFGILAFLLWYSLIKGDGWVVLFLMLSVGAYILALNPNPVWLGVWAANIALLLWKYRHALLTERPTLKPLHRAKV